MDLLRGIKDTKVKAFKGWPRSTVLSDLSGTMSGIRINTSFKTPFGNKVADAAAFLGTTALVVASVHATAEMPDPKWEEPLLVAGLYLPIKWGARAAVRPSVTVDVMEGGVTVRGLLFPRRYAREDIQGFAVEKHELAEQERAQHEFEARRDQVKRRARNRTRYYQDAAHVVLIVAGERIKVADMARARDSHRFVDRCNRALHQMDRLLERREVTRRTQGALSAPGQLPE